MSAPTHNDFFLGIMASQDMRLLVPEFDDPEFLTSNALYTHYLDVPNAHVKTRLPSTARRQSLHRSHAARLASKNIARR